MVLIDLYRARLIELQDAADARGDETASGLIDLVLDGGDGAVHALVALSDVERNPDTQAFLDRLALATAALESA